MKKKGMLLFALVAAAALSAGVLSACKEEHVLTYHAAVAATCTETGTVEYWSCSECGKNFADEAATQEISSLTTSALGHDFGAWEVVSPATCTENGEQRQTCSRCGEEVVEVMKAPGHSFGDWATVPGKEPTCTEQGTQERECSVCHTVEERSIPANGHVFDGGMICTVCGASRTSDKLAFTRNADGSYTVSGIGKETEKEIYIPIMYSNSPVTAIGEDAFAGNKEITGIYITGGIETIGSGAFDGCTNLVSLQLANSVKTIGGKAFYQTGLTMVSIPDSVTEIGTQAFGGCMQLTELSTPRTNTAYQTIDGNLYNSDGTVLLQYAIGSKNISFLIPSGVKEVESTALFRAVNLKSVTVPASVEVLGDRVFGTCTSLETIAVDEKNESYRAIGGDLYSYDGSVLLQYAIGKSSTSFLSANTVKRVASGAFEGAKSLKEVTLSTSLTEIGEGAFRDCTALAKVGLPASLVTIGEEGFRGCTSLKEITIPASVQTIGVGAFQGCTELENAYFEETEGWSAGSIPLDAESLAKPSTAAVYLTDAYRAGEWTRK